MMIGQIEGVSAGTLKDVLLIFGGAITIAGALVMMFRKSKTSVEPQPLITQHAPEYVSLEQCRISHETMAASLARHEHQIEALWQTVRDENTAIRAEIARGFRETSQQLGLIEGELKRLLN